MKLHSIFIPLAVLSALSLTGACVPLPEYRAAKKDLLACRLRAGQLELEKSNLQEDYTARIQAQEHRVDELRVELEEARAAGGDRLNELEQRYRKARADLDAAKAAFGRIVGSYESAADALAREVDAQQARISYLEDRLRIELLDEILFDVGSDRLSTRGREVLQKIVPVLEQAAESRAMIAGHTDITPVRGGSNWDLSARRALSVVHALTDLGVPSERLAVGAYGPHWPVATNDTEEGRRKNRRIEILLESLPRQRLGGPCR